jgi:DNA-binding ferritin-like protein
MPNPAAELVMKCFHARTNAHVLHLQTDSYAEHKALEEFYTELVELADRFAETYQGSYGVIKDYPSGFEFADDCLDLVEEFEDWIGKHRAEIGDKEDTHLQNLIDEIVALARSTRYQLRTFT